MPRIAQIVAKCRATAAGNYRRTNDGRYTRLHATSVGDIRQRENQEHDRRDGKEHYATHFMIVSNGK